jgi:hypothetical protein
MRNFLVFFLSCLLVVSCGRNEAKLAQARAGTWVAEFSDGTKSTLILRADGGYSCQLSCANGKVVNIEGTIRFTNRYQIDTETKNSDDLLATNLPQVTKNVLVHMDENEFILEPEIYFPDKRVTFRKVK